MKQVTVNGAIKHRKEGFFWCLVASMEGADDVFYIDSSMSGAFYESKEDAEIDMKIVGKELTNELANILKEIAPQSNPYVIDKTLLH